MKHKFAIDRCFPEKFMTSHICNQTLSFWQSTDSISVIESDQAAKALKKEASFSYIFSCDLAKPTSGF